MGIIHGGHLRGIVGNWPGGRREEEQKFANDKEILTTSWCRRLRVEGMCCQGLAQWRILAAKFQGYWSLSRALNGTPDRTQLQWSSWEVLKSRIKGLSYGLELWLG